MTFDEFLDEVQRVSGLDRAKAERAVRATLETLAERVTGGEARDIAEYLPQELRPLLESAREPAQRWSRGEFVRHVAEREGVDKSAAQEHALAVFVALGRAVAPGELRDLTDQLPSDYDPWLEAAGIGRLRALTEDRLASRVAELTGLDEAHARRALEAVLELLAVRISFGEVEDLMNELPADLLPPLLRGLGESREATRMTADEFVARVAEREGVSPDEAREHARAVFTALREVVSAKEFSDMAAQLSSDYEPLLSAAD